MKSSIIAFLSKGASSLSGLISPYLGYVALVGVGAFGIVMYLYADEKEEHRLTSSELATMTANHDLLKQQYTMLLASQEATEAQVEALKKEKADVQDKFEEASMEASERYSALREEQARLIAVNEQRERLKQELAAAKADLASSETTFVPIPAPPVSLAPPDQVMPDVIEEEIVDAICNTTPFGDPVIDYVSERLRIIYENGVSLSDNRRGDPE